jgi:hypothetical protein
VTSLARLVVPALRWDRAHGFRYLDGLIDDALELGVGGFFIESGPRDDVAALIGRLHAASKEPLLIALRAESGAGQAIEGLSHLPPFAALSRVAVVDQKGPPSLDPEPIRRAARITAREMRNIGANWALAPFCDTESPSTGVRAASDDPAVVGAVVGEWVDACQAEAVIATAIAYDGKASSTITAAIDAGASCVMATSAARIDGTLRGTMNFEGLVTSRPFDHDPAITPQNEAAIAVESVTAGCDIILAPGDLNGVADALGRATSSRALSEQRVHAASDRIARWAGWAQPSAARELSLDDVMWGRQVADGATRYLRGDRPRIGASVEAAKVGLFAAGSDPFDSVLKAMHIDVRGRGNSAAAGRDPLVILFAPAGNDVTRDDAARVMTDVKSAAEHARDAVVVAFCHPRLARAITGDAPLLCAWEPSRPMQEAAARALFSRA